MHFFVNRKDLNNAIREFKRAKIKGLVLVGSESPDTVTIDGFEGNINKTGPATIPERRLRVTIPARYTAEDTSRGSFKCDLKDLKSDGGDVEISADCFGLTINGDLRECRETSSQNMPWENVAGVSWTDGREITQEDCCAIAWVLRAMGSTEELCKRGFDRLCIHDGVAEATDGNRAHRANVSFGAPEMLVPAVMADLMSRLPGALNFRADEDYEYAEYRAGSIRMETVRKKNTCWPDFERIMPYNAPSVTMHAVHVLEHVKAAVDGYDGATVHLSCGKGKRNLRVESLSHKAQMKPPFDGLVRTVDGRLETAELEEPCLFDSFGMGAEYNAAYLVDALAGFCGYAEMYYTDNESPLMIADDTGRAAIVMPIV